MNDLALLLDIFGNSEETKLLIYTIIFYLGFTAPEKWRISNMFYRNGLCKDGKVRSVPSHNNGLCGRSGNRYWRDRFGFFFGHFCRGRGTVLCCCFLLNGNCKNRNYYKVIAMQTGERHSINYISKQFMYEKNISQLNIILIMARCMACETLQ